MFKKRNLILIPTTYGKGATLYTSIRNPEIMCNGEDNGNEFWKPHHLYLISDDEIKEGDWFYHPNKALVSQIEKAVEFSNNEGIVLINNFNGFVCKKIIATTDKFLGLPEPSKEFIEKYIQEYNKRDIITEVVVEYEDILSDGIYFDGLWDFKKKVIGEKLKVNTKNNTITVKEVKNTWTREEVIKLLEKYQEDLGDNSPGIYSEISKWKENNL